jgi:hypothetical protein
LEQASEEVRNLVEHPGYRWLHRAVKERQDKLVQRLIHGSNVSHDTYVSQAAMASGLDQVLYVAQSVQLMAERRQREEAEKARQALAKEQAA